MNAKRKGQGALSGSTNRYTNLFVFFLLAGLIGALFSAYKVVQDAGYDARYLELTGELRVLSQQIATSSRQATSGEAEAFDLLAESRRDFNQTLRTLINGNSDLPSPQAMLSDELSQLNQLWGQVDSASETIVNNRERILFLHEVAKTLNDSIPELQAEYNNVVEILLENRAPADQVAVAQKQSWLAERIARNVDKMLQGEEAAKEAADQFNLDASLFGSVLNGMLQGNKAMQISRVTDRDARQSLEEINKLFEFVSGSVDEIFQASPDLLNARNATEAIVVDSPKIMEATSSLAESINNLDSRRQITTNWVLGFVGLTIFALFAIGVNAIRVSNQRVRETQEANDRNQNAIMRLLDEIADLADGDLTTTATVTEDFTGAIADSVNYTIDQLRILVSSINDTAVKVSTAAQESQSTALHLAEPPSIRPRKLPGPRRRSTRWR